MRSGRTDAGHGRGHHGRNRREAEDRKRQDEHGKHRVFHLARFDLLAEQLRSAADHKTSDENSKNREDDHAVEARTDAAGQDLAELYEEHRNQTAEAGERAVHAVDPAIRKAGRNRRVKRGHRLAETDFLAFHVAESRV